MVEVESRAVAEVGDDHRHVPAGAAYPEALAEDPSHAINELVIVINGAEVTCLVPVIGGEPAREALRPSLHPRALTENGPIGRRCNHKVNRLIGEFIDTRRAVTHPYLGERSGAVQGHRLGGDTLAGDVCPFGRQFDADGPPPPTEGRDEGRAHPREGIQHGLALLAEESD